MKAIARSLLPWQHAPLIWQLTRREVAQRYRASWLGTLWLVLSPVLMLVVYTVVFRHIFKLRWADTEGTDLGFAIHLFSGLIVFNFISECLMRAPRLVLDQPHLVKKVVFPLDVLAWSSTLPALLGLLISGGLLVLAQWMDAGALPASALALPVVWLPLVPLALAIGWALSAIGTFVRDVANLVGLAASVLLFLSPVFFPTSALPGAWRAWLQLNPLATVMEQTRQVLIAGHWPDWSALWVVSAACLALAAGSAMLFQRVRPGFADVV